MMTPEKFFDENGKDETKKSNQPAPEDAKTPAAPRAIPSHYEMLAGIETMYDQVEEMGRQLTELKKTLGRLNFDIVSANVPRN